jgi:hypothetical protein
LRERASLAARHGAGAEVADELVSEERQRGLVEGELERAAHAGALPLVQRGEHAERRPDAGAEVDQGDADAHGRPVALAGHAHDPRRGLQQRVVARLATQRAAGAERPDRAVDEPGVARPQLGGAEAVPLRGSRPEALEEHVRPVDETEHDLAAALVAELDGERALAGVRGEKHRALSLQKRRPPGAGLVAGERLYLDDLGSERREQLRRRGACDGGADVDDAGAGERAQLAHGSSAYSQDGLPRTSTSRSNRSPTFSATPTERRFPCWISEMRRVSPRSVTPQSRSASAASVA